MTADARDRAEPGVREYSRRGACLAMASGLLGLQACGRKEDSAPSASGFDWTSLVLTAFEGLGAEDATIRAKASTYTDVRQWRLVSDFDVAAAGGSACALPLSGYATLPIEFGYLMRQIYNSALGIGHILYGSATKDDFAVVLAQWGEEYVVSSAVLGPVYTASELALGSFGQKAAEVAAEKVTDKALGMLRSGAVTAATAPAKAQIAVAAKEVPHSIISNVLAHHSGSKVFGKIGAKVAAKVGAKFGAKYGTKMAAAWIPGLSGVACGGINWWIMDGILTTSEQYFSTLAQFRQQRYGRARK